MRLRRIAERSVLVVMNVVLHSVAGRREDGRYDLSISVGEESPRTFGALYDDSTPKYSFCHVEQELFLRLSDLALKRYGNCAVYQMELMGIIGAVHRRERIPELPAQLGTTPFVNSDWGAWTSNKKCT